MCEWGDDVAIRIANESGGGMREVLVDRCISDLILTLNENGICTVASCCGHGNCPGRITLKDGREFVIAYSQESANRMIEFEVSGKRGVTAL